MRGYTFSIKRSPRTHRGLGLGTLGHEFVKLSGANYDDGVVYGPKGGGGVGGSPRNAVSVAIWMWGVAGCEPEGEFYAFA